MVAGSENGKRVTGSENGKRVVRPLPAPSMPRERNAMVGVTSLSWLLELVLPGSHHAQLMQARDRMHPLLRSVAGTLFQQRRLTASLPRVQQLDPSRVHAASTGISVCRACASVMHITQIDGCRRLFAATDLTAGTTTSFLSAGHTHVLHLSPAGCSRVHEEKVRTWREGTNEARFAGGR